MEKRGMRDRDKMDGGRHHSRQNKGRDKEENGNRRRGKDNDDDDDSDDNSEYSSDSDNDDDNDDRLGDGKRERPWQSVGIADAGQGHAAPTRYSDRGCSSG